MPRFLIDANLPYRFAVWRGDNYQHVFDLNDAWTDSQIWQHAKTHDQVIVSKDADFSDRMILSDPPPRVVQLRVGNLKLRDFHAYMQHIWPQVCELASTHKLVIVHAGSIECVQ